MYDLGRTINFLKIIDLSPHCDDKKGYVKMPDHVLSTKESLYRGETSLLIKAVKSGAEVWKGAAMEKFPPKGSVKDFKDRICLSTLHHEDRRVVSGAMIAWSLWYARKQCPSLPAEMY